MKYPLALSCAALVLTAVYGLSLLAPIYWWADIFRSFILQYLCAAIFVGGLCLFHKKQKITALLMILIALCTGYEYFSGYRSADPVNGNQLTIAQINKHGRNRDLRLLQDWLKKSPADLVVVQEVLRSDVDLLAKDAELKKIYPHRYPRQRAKNLDIYVLSRFELRNSTILNLSTPDGPTKAMRITLMHDDGNRVTVYSMHTARPFPHSEYLKRNEQMLSMARIIATDNAPYKTLIGDFNTTPWSPAFREMLRISGMNSDRPSLVHYTSWPSYTQIPLLQIPIDHVLAGKNINVTKRNAGPYLRSDHRPVIATLVLDAIP